MEVGELVVVLELVLEQGVGGAVVLDVLFDLIDEVDLRAGNLGGVVAEVAAAILDVGKRIS